MKETNPKEYVNINGIWQHTNMSWFVDKEKMNAPFQINKPGGQSLQNHQCVAHVHHWKTELEEYCRIDEEWKCVRCHDVVPDAIQSMIKLYRPLKDV